MRAARATPGDRFFFYGTLLDPDIRRRVLGRRLGTGAMEPAMLAGWRRVHAAGRWYPMLVRGGRRDAVEGAVASGLDADEIARLIDYEGDNWRLARVTVRTRAGRACRALVFLPRKGLRPGAERWELGAWQKREKPRVLRLGLWSAVTRATPAPRPSARPARRAASRCARNRP